MDAGPRRDGLLGLLRQAGRPLTAGELAGLAGLHPNTARFHLDALVAEDAVERAPDPRGGRGRPRLLYAARPGSSRGPRSFRLLAQMLVELAETLGVRRAMAEQTGRAWGSRLVGTPTDPAPRTPREAVTRLNVVLDEVGFQPTVEGDEAGSDTEIHLHHCPFREVAETDPEVVCALHLGLMQGAFSALRSPVTVSSLEPFVRPDLCVTRLEPAGLRAG